MKRLWIGVMLIVSGIGFTVHLVSDTAAKAQGTFDRQAMLLSIVENVIVPGQAAFIAASEELQTAADEFAASPNAGNLAALQLAWRQASNVWQEIAIFAMDLWLTAMHNQISKPPANIKFIEDILQGDDEITEAYIHGVGSTSKGLPAIEYLIFSTDFTAEETAAMFADRRRRQYLLALAANLRRNANDLRRYWSESGRHYAKTFIQSDQEGGQLQGSINMLANRMFYHLEDNLQMRLGHPAGIALGSEPRPDLVESPRSGQSLQHIAHNLMGLQNTFNGGQLENSLGFDDYLDFLGAEFEGRPLSEVINARFQAAIQAIHSIEQPLHIAVVESPTEIASLYEAMRQLLILIRADMKSHLSILVTLSDRDGDQ